MADYGKHIVRTITAQDRARAAARILRLTAEKIRITKGQRQAILRAHGYDGQSGGADDALR